MADQTERATVRTYVPAYQKERWREQADAMEMSLSEFVRTMVQAGRVDFEVPTLDAARDARNGDGTESDDRGSRGDDAETGDHGSPDASADDEAGAGSPRSGDATPGGEGLEDRILAVLDEEGVCSWDRLVEVVTGDLEERLEESLERLQRDNRVGYRGREGGYAVIEDGD